MKKYLNNVYKINLINENSLNFSYCYTVFRKEWRYLLRIVQFLYGKNVKGFKIEFMFGIMRKIILHPNHSQRHHTKFTIWTLPR